MLHTDCDNIFDTSLSAKVGKLTQDTSDFFIPYNH